MPITDILQFYKQFYKFFMGDACSSGQHYKAKTKLTSQERCALGWHVVRTPWGTGCLVAKHSNNIILTNLTSIMICYYLSSCTFQCFSHIQVSMQSFYHTMVFVTNIQMNIMCSKASLVAWHLACKEGLSPVKDWAYDNNCDRVISHHFQWHFAAYIAECFQLINLFCTLSQDCKRQLGNASVKYSLMCILSGTVLTMPFLLSSSPKETFTMYMIFPVYTGHILFKVMGVALREHDVS